MYQSKGIGLAAVQVGILKRILVIDVSGKDEKKNPLCFINPKIKKISKEQCVVVIVYNDLFQPYGCVQCP